MSAPTVFYLSGIVDDISLLEGNFLQIPHGFYTYILVCLSGYFDGADHPKSVFECMYQAYQAMILSAVDNLPLQLLGYYQF